ncbi:MAG: LytTR family DNA-binding domain-containing protein [Eubacteriales bacterium]
MLKIAIVDDMERDRDSLVSIANKIANEWNDKFHIKAFDSGEAICDDLEQNTYDVILLDIQMDGMDGGETAKKIDLLAPTSYVVFITSCSDMSGLMYDFNVIGFLHKPATKAKIEEIFMKLVDRMKSGNYFNCTFNGISQAIKFEEILCISKINRITSIQTKNEIIPISENLDEVWKKLQEFDDFCMINRSFIVNFKYVKFVKSLEIKIEFAGKLYEHINVGRGLKNIFKERHAKYMRKLVQKEKTKWQ